MSTEAPLTERQRDVLRCLDAAIRAKPGFRVSPLNVGGTDGSHHSATLAQLCKKGLATRRKHTFFGDCYCRCGPEAMFGHRCKGSFSYGITDAGQEVVAGLKRRAKRKRQHDAKEA